MLEAERKRGLVLVVDDDVTIRLLAREALEQAGFEVQEAEDGRSALDRFRRSCPDLVLLDVRMPGSDGFEACQEMLRQRPEVPVVVMTGADDLNSVQRAFEVGAKDFVAKPVNWLVLTHRCRFLLKAAEAMAALIEAQDRIRAAQRLTRLGTWQLDVRTDEIHGSEELFHIFGLRPHAGPIPRKTLMKRVHPTDRLRLKRAVTEAVQRGHSHREDFRIVRSDGSRRVIRLAAEPVYDDTGRLQSVSGTSQDITERARAEEQARFLTEHDALTGLANRVLLREILERAVAASRTSGTRGALLSLGLRDFERIPETFGHGVGDRLLQVLAERLGRFLQEEGAGAHTRDPCLSPALARTGGIEFALMAPQLDEETRIASLAQRLLDRVCAPVELEGREVQLQAGIGIALWPQDGDRAETLLRNASAAMEHSRREGLGRYRFYKKSMNQLALARFEMATALRRAVERDELRLLYQPKLDVSCGRLSGVEALLRWQHPERGLLLPASFVPLAEESGLIVPIGTWVLREACRQHRTWLERGLGPLPVAANLSALQLRHDELLQTISMALREADMEAKYLELEITETALLQDVERAEHILSALSAEGLSIALDDFGTGYSSLGYLARFPIDTLKIDRSFVSRIGSGDINAALIEVMLHLARTLGLNIVAEGVESLEQWRFLRERGCHAIQGFLHSPPLRPEELLQQVASGRYPVRLDEPTGPDVS